MHFHAIMYAFKTIVINPELTGVSVHSLTFIYSIHQVIAEFQSAVKVLIHLCL